MNPCPCGYLGHHSGKCRCTPDQVARYRSRISGPLLDRIDIQIEVPALVESELLSAPTGESSSVIRARVEATARRQLERQGKLNAQLTPRKIDEVCRLDSKGEALLRRAIASLHLSARAYHRVLKVARTIADLAGSESVQISHVAEAVQYRRIAHVD